MDVREKIASPRERERIIMSHLRASQKISIPEIASEVKASEVTIRRDLLKLEGKGLLLRTRTGAVNNNTSAENLFSYDDKINQKRAQKDYICRIAAGYIKAGDIIFIDCGSTVSLLTQHITRIESLTVITNSLPIVSGLSKYPNIKVILIGGQIDHKRQASYGLSAKNNISMYHANKAFIGADGISLVQGITSYNEKSASVTLQMAENSDEIFLLCDSSKLEKNSFVKYAPLDFVDYVITDKGVDRTLIGKYQDKCGVRLICE